MHATHHLNSEPPCLPLNSLLWNLLFETCFSFTQMYWWWCCSCIGMAVTAHPKSQAWLLLVAWGGKYLWDYLFGTHSPPAVLQFSHFRSCDLGDSPFFKGRRVWKCFTIKMQVLLAIKIFHQEPLSEVGKVSTLNLKNVEIYIQML